jgi:hypothetical protein
MPSHNWDRVRRERPGAHGVPTGDVAGTQSGIPLSTGAGHGPPVAVPDAQRAWLRSTLAHPWRRSEAAIAALEARPSTRRANLARATVDAERRDRLRTAADGARTAEERTTLQAGVTATAERLSHRITAASA